MTDVIHILNASHLTDDELKAIAREIEHVFHSRVTVQRAGLDLERAFDGSRGQYNSNVLLGEIVNALGTPDAKEIAIVDVDLFIPVLTFIFGEAQLDGRGAIVSTYRLNDTLYGLPGNHEKLLHRLTKEIVHELGHTFGLYHCRQFECVMRSSTYVEEIDLKRTSPCAGCLDLLAQSRVVAQNSMG